MFDRVKWPPWGVQGGKEAKPGQITVVKKSGEREIIYKSKAYPLEPGDMIIVETGGGGGYGAICIGRERRTGGLSRGCRHGWNGKPARPQTAAGGSVRRR